jgi:hypothetical protein
MVTVIVMVEVEVVVISSSTSPAMAIAALATKMVKMLLSCMLIDDLDVECDIESMGGCAARRDDRVLRVVKVRARSTTRPAFRLKGKVKRQKDLKYRD